MNNYCLTSQCKKSILSQAKEIKIDLVANGEIVNYIETFPEATLVIKCFGQIDNFNKLTQLNTLTKGTVIFALDTLAQIKEFQNLNLKWYYDYPISTYFDLNNLVALGAESVLIKSPLFNDLAYVCQIAGKVRLVPNVAYYAQVPAKDGVIGSWLRPEDLSVLENLNVVLEFKDCENNPKKEEGLFRVYSSGEWKGDLNNIITNLNYHTENIYIPPNLAEKRLSCGQRCQEGASCHLCYRYMKMAQREFISQLKGK